MKKIILIDDRSKRKVLFEKETGIQLKDYDNVLDIFTAGSYEKLLDEFSKDNYDRLVPYDVIITHRSAYGKINSKVLDKLKSLCKKQQKSLVFFSGGISSLSINNDPFEHLLMNSKSFYSDNLKLFLKNSLIEKPNLLLLALGERWKVNLLLNSLENINLFVGKNANVKEVVYHQFEDETNIHLIQNFLNIEKPKIVNDFVQMNELKKFTQNLTNQIKQQVVLNV